MFDKHLDNFIHVLADWSIVPDYRWTFNFFAKLLLKLLGKINSPEKLILLHWHRLSRQQIILLCYPDTCGWDSDRNVCNEL